MVRKVYNKRTSRKSTEKPNKTLRRSNKKSQEPVQKSNSNPTKVFVDFPASANVQLVFRPAPKD